MNKLTLTDIEGFLVKKVTKFGNGAKVDCPKQYLGKTVYLVVVGNEPATGIGSRRAFEKRKSGAKKSVRNS
ncbi:MAG: DUF2080 family transposase-associated protein [Nanoarchaeota archaeon]|nr:DUF2080 family transposase-associated protein [Nanoarchaeota archaeon]